jgi:hypothetical protein
MHYGERHIRITLRIGIQEFQYNGLTAILLMGEAGERRCMGLDQSRKASTTEEGHDA